MHINVLSQSWMTMPFLPVHFLSTKAKHPTIIINFFFRIAYTFCFTEGIFRAQLLELEKENAQANGVS